MRSWQPAAPPDSRTALLSELIGHVGGMGFRSAVIAGVQGVLPAASWSVYRLGAAPALLLSAAAGIRDTTHDCWRAYLSGPHQGDRTLLPAAGDAACAPPAWLSHLTAGEAPAEHRAKVYEPHGMVERISVAQRLADGALFAVNFYRHGHQPAFRDAAIDDFGALAVPLLALVQRHVALAPPVRGATDFDARLRQLCPALTLRERAVCVRLLQGMTQDGIAVDLGLSLPTVKTYRNRAFARLGIHFRNELFARVLGAGAALH